MKKQHIESICCNLPTVATERLILRKLHIRDTDDMFEFASQKKVSEYLLWEPHVTRRYTHEFLADIQRMYRKFEYYEWAIVEKETKKMIGTCGFTKFDMLRNTGEIGYSINPTYWGRGYATEAAKATVKFGFDVLQLSTVEAYYVLENAASAAVLAHTGMRYRGECEPMFIKGREQRIGVFALSQDEYNQLSKNTASYERELLYR